MKRFLRVAWYIAPSVLAFCMAAAVYAQTSLAEENRRLLERTDERFRRIDEQYTQVSSRLDTIEKYQFWLFVTTGAAGGVVGVDKAGYWYRERRREPRR